MYFMKGSLPWMGLQAKSKKEKYDKIWDCKKHTKVEDLCKGCAPAFVEYGKYVRNLAFEEKPDYAYCRKLFHNELKLMNFKYDYEYDWVVKKTLKKDQENQESKSRLEIEEQKVAVPLKAPTKPTMVKQ